VMERSLRGGVEQFHNSYAGAAAVICFRGSTWAQRVKLMEIADLEIEVVGGDLALIFGAGLIDFRLRFV